MWHLYLYKNWSNHFSWIIISFPMNHIACFFYVHISILLLCLYLYWSSFAKRSISSFFSLARKNAKHIWWHTIAHIKHFPHSNSKLNNNSSSSSSSKKKLTISRQYQFARSINRDIYCLPLFFLLSFACTRALVYLWNINITCVFVRLSIPV